MFRQSTIPAYGGKEDPLYVAMAGPGTFIPFISFVWSTNVKDANRWSQAGTSGYPSTPNPNLGEPPIISSSGAFSDNACAFGNNMLIIGSSAQMLPGTGNNIYAKYLKAGQGFQPITVDSSNTSAPFYNQTPRDITFGNGIFVSAVTQGNGAVSVFRSADGLTWTKQSLGVSASSYSTNVTFDNGKFFVSYSVGSGANPTFMFKSTNGTTWTSFNAPNNTSPGWTIKALNNNLFSTSNTSNTIVYFSTNEGAAWSAITPTKRVIPEVFANGVYVNLSVDATANPAANYYTSTNGINWTSRPNTFNLVRITVNAGKFYAVDIIGANIYESTDGVTWTLWERALARSSNDRSPNGILGIFFGTL